LRSQKAVIISVEIFNGSDATGKQTPEKEATCVVASTLDQLLQKRP